MTTQADASKIQKTSSTERSIQLSAARILACIAIVVLHTVFAANEYFIDTVTQGENLVSRIVENNMMWAVPVFLMVTGALQLDTRKALTWRKLYGKYISRVFAALVVFSLLFRLFDIFMDGEKFTAGGFVVTAFTEMITGRGWGHLWYLYLLTGIYVLLPFYRVIADKCSDEELRYLICVLAVFTSVIPAIEGSGINIAFYISQSIIYPLYVFLGYMMHHGRLKVSRSAAAAMAAVSTAGIIILDILKYSRGIDVPDVWFGYSSPLVVLQSAGVFSLINGCRAELSGRARALISRLDGYTFGVYLISMLFVRLFFRYLKFNPYDGMAAVLLAVSVIAVLVAAAAVTAVLKKIPVFSKIL